MAGERGSDAYAAAQRCSCAYRSWSLVAKKDAGCDSDTLKTYVPAERLYMLRQLAFWPLFLLFSEQAADTALTLLLVQNCPCTAPP